MGKAPREQRHIGNARTNPVEQKKKTHHFAMNKDLGQHLLKNPKIAEAIVDKAGIQPSDVVLEVGPGTGNLTEKILERASKVIAVEYDTRMAAELTKRFQGKPVERKLEILVGDCIKTELPFFNVCISNTPYQISSPLVFKLLNLQQPPRTSILMFQQEFAQRLVARPGEKLYGRLAANAQMWANCSMVMKVGKNNFKPPPQVESAVVRMEIKQPRPNINAAEWDGLLRILFVRPNRTVSAGFKSKDVLAILEKNYKTFLAQSGDGDDVMDLDENTIKQKIEQVLTETEMGDKRSARCDERDFLRLLYSFNKAGIHFA